MSYYNIVIKRGKVKGKGKVKWKGKEAHKKIPLLYISWDLEGFEQVVWREIEQRVFRILNR